MLLLFLVTQSGLTLCYPMDCSSLVSPLSMGFPRQEYWTGLSFPSPEDFPDPGIKPVSPALVGRFFNHSATMEAHKYRKYPIFKKITGKLLLCIGFCCLKGLSTGSYFRNKMIQVTLANITSY